MASPYIIRKIINKTFSGRFMLSRLSHYGFAGRIIDYLLFKDDDILYLPRDNSIPVNQNIDQPADMVLPSQILDRIIEKAGHHWIMDFCICRGCGRCVDTCPNQAIELVVMDQDYLSTTFGRLTTAVDLS